MNSRPSKAESDRRFTLPATLDKVLGLVNLRAFTLDPCADRLSTCGLTCYYAESNGLILPWNGNVFVNPPWSDIEPWIEKGIAELGPFGHAKSATYLLPDNRQGTKWWQKYVEPIRDGRGANGLILTTHYLPGRPRYGSPDDPEGLKAKSPPFGAVALHMFKAYT